MRDLFAGISRQEQATLYLQHAYETAQATHAYLIAGGVGDEAAQIASRFAAGLIAGDDDGSYDEAMRNVHPDLHVYGPGGAGSYLVEQIRELTHDAELAPIRACHKVYIVKDAQRLSGAPANAFLKTLEEPPQNVTCILTATSEAAVLETLRSRCEVLVLNAAPSHAPLANAQVMEMLHALSRGCSNHDLLAYAKRLVEIAREDAQAHAEDGLGAESYIEKYEDYLSQGAKRHIEQQEKRDATARERAVLLGLLEMARVWLRDCLAVREGASHLLAYPDYVRQTSAVAKSATVTGLLCAIDAVATAGSRISYNVTPQLATEAMFLEIREALCRK